MNEIDRKYLLFIIFDYLFFEDRSVAYQFLDLIVHPADPDGQVEDVNEQKSN